MAKMINPFEEDALPPFDGFPGDTMRFLRELKENNDRDWFNANKERYENNVKEPMLMLLATLAVRIMTISPDIVLEPKKAMYRIYRDVRFSKDKAPYKTWVAAAFTYQGMNRKKDSSFYFHFTPGEVGVGGGLYAPSGDQLKKLRKALDADAGAFRRILAAPAFAKHFGSLLGEELTRVPQGFDKEHPDADLLRKKQFLAWAKLPASIVTKAAFADTLMEHFSAMAPFVRYLAENS